MADIGRNVFANNWGGSIEEATGAVGEFTKAMNFDAPIEDIKTMAEQGFALQQVFDFSIEEQTRALSVMSTSFQDVAADGTKFGDMMTTFLQNNDANADDLLETIGEYSPLMNQLGMDSEQFFGVLQSGLQAGARDTDYVADLFKEFGIRIVDGSDTTKKALESLGLAGLGDQVASGMVTGVDAFAMIQAELAKLPPDMQAAMGGVDLFGTKFEDLGPKVFGALSTDPLTNFEGSAVEAGNAINNNLGGALGTLKRTALDAFADMAGGEGFGNFKQSIIDGINTLTGALRPAIEQLGPVLEAIGDGFGSAFGGGEGEGMAGMFESLAASIANLDFEAIAAGAKSFGEAIGGALKWLIDNKELVAEWAIKIGAMVAAFAVLRNCTLDDLPHFFRGHVPFPLKSRRW
jgi:phage-related minor tail protein